jgi:predicted glycoside hydrolase/deacetylase ChbG (UPF0249 family)
MSPRRLVVTADDVGLARGMTLGALKAHTEGIVTAVAVAATGRDFAPAVAAIAELQGIGHALDVGIHWTLVEETPLSPAGQVRSLLTGGGEPLPHFRAFARRYASGRLKPVEIEGELRRQTEKLLETGLPVLHANAHQHLHVLPPVFEIATRLAEEYAIPFLRIPGEPAARRRLTLRHAQLAILNRYGQKARQKAAGRTVEAADRTVGILDAGHLSPDKLPRILADAAGVTELVCHPGLGDRDLAALYPTWEYEWDRETATLCDPNLPAALAAAGLELTSFSQLGQSLGLLGHQPPQHA